MSWYPWYPPSRPRDVTGGIKAQNRRGTFAESWWAKRWIAVLESFHLGNRLQRGRRYARRGQVLKIEVDKGGVTAKVQGSRPHPYDVTIRVQPLPPAAWQKAADLLTAQALFAAKLLAGEMPHEIEDVFRQAGHPLFPATLKDLKTDCSCPDWSNPCKHLAAVYYLLGEEFDRDPFLLFRLRGMTRDEFTALLGASAAPEQVQAAPEPLPADPARFWKGAALPEVGSLDLRPPPVSAALLKRLGKFPFWRGERPLQEVLEPVYAAAARRAREL